MTDSKRNRGPLIALLAVFAAPMLVAMLLGALGWRPLAAHNFGSLVEPPIDFRQVVAHAQDGHDLVWNSAAGVWHVLIEPPPACAAKCLAGLDVLGKVWATLGRNSPRVQLVYVGVPDAATLEIIARSPNLAIVSLQPNLLLEPPAAATAPAVVDAQGIALSLIDPNGYLIMRYARGSDPADLRRDLSRLVK